MSLGGRRLYGWWLTGAAVLALSLAVSCGGGEGPQIIGNGDVVVTVMTATVEAGPSITPTPSPSPSPTPTPQASICSANPDAAPPSLLQVQHPLPNQRVKNPLEVRGWGSTIGRDDAGVAIAMLNEKLETLQLADVPPQPRAARVPPAGLEITPDTRPFGADLPFGGIAVPSRVCIWVYLDTAEDGTPRGVVQVPVELVP